MNKSFKVASPSELGIEVEDLCRFFDAHWKRRLALAIPDFYRWQFMAPPENAGRDMCCVAVDEGGALLGIMGLNERPFLLNGQSRKGAELTTWVVAPKARGRGIGKAIMAYLQDAYEILIGMGITQAALPIYLGSGFEYMPHIPRFVRVYDVQAIAPHARIDREAKDFIEKHAAPERIAYKAGAVGAGDLAEQAQDLGAEFNCFLRDGAYLSWRYTDHPIFEYESFVVEGGGKGVGVVIRRDAVDGMEIAHVIDCFGSQADMPAALAFIDDYCRERGIHVVDFYCTSSKIGEVFENGGWFVLPEDKSFSFIHLFHPPEMREPPTTSLVYWARDNMDELKNTDRLYVTKQDLDLDRPTAATYEKMGKYSVTADRI
jgi:GNAT superfamily N-acetyltransferase